MINLSKFKTIPGFSKYMISEDGIVYSIKRKQIISVGHNWAGYQTVTITDDNGFRSPRKVHRLVYKTYIGNLIDGLVIDHIDDNILNNHYTNLQQITPTENSLKSFNSGKNKSKVVWKEKDIRSICEMMEENIPTYQIFINLGVDYYSNRIACNMLIGQLRRGEIHKTISSEYNIRNYICGVNKKDCKLNISDVSNIYMRLLFGDKAAKLAKEFLVSHSTICKIRDKKTWKTLTDSLDNYFIEECSTTISEESTP